MTANETPIAWGALKDGTSVHSSDGEELGKVAEIVGDEGKDIFSGIVLNPGWFKERRFVPAEMVGEITTDAVHLTITADEAIERLRRGG